MFSRYREPFEEAPQHLSAAPIEPVEPSLPVVELYLIALDAKLLSSLPAETRQVVQMEVRQHLEASIAAREELGMEHEAAVAEAIARFGDPARLARRFRAAYRGPVGPSPVAAFRESFPCFGVCGATLVILDSVSWFRPGSSPLASNGASGWLAWCFLGPFLAGIVSGRRAPRRAALGVFYALGLLAILTAPLGQWEWHRTVDIPVSLLFALWLPGGCLGALAGSLTHRVRIRRRNAAVQ